MSSHRDPRFGDALGLGLPPGDPHYRAYVGPPEDYDLVAAMCFSLLTALGMRQQHRVLDIGCGSLRVGRLLIPYLNRGGYTGLEPLESLVAEGIEREVGQDQVDIKQPRFVYSDDAGDLIAESLRFDYVLAQSIFSHCGPDLLDRWLSQVAALLADDGVLVATFIPGAEDNSTRGWIYPDCVGYMQETITAMAERRGLVFVPLDWRHPRQQWGLFGRRGLDMSLIPADGLGWNTGFARFNARRQDPRQPR